MIRRRSNSSWHICGCFVQIDESAVVRFGDSFLHRHDYFVRIAQLIQSFFLSATGNQQVHRGVGFQMLVIADQFGESVHKIRFVPLSGFASLEPSIISTTSAEFRACPIHREGVVRQIARDAGAVHSEVSDLVSVSEQLLQRGGVVDGLSSVSERQAVSDTCDFIMAHPFPIGRFLSFIISQNGYIGTKDCNLFVTYLSESHEIK
jgi:hypothetical protein